MKIENPKCVIVRRFDHVRPGDVFASGNSMYMCIKNKDGQYTAVSLSDGEEVTFFDNRDDVAVVQGRFVIGEEK